MMGPFFLEEGSTEKLNHLSKSVTLAREFKRQLEARKQLQRRDYKINQKAMKPPWEENAIDMTDRTEYSQGNGDWVGRIAPTHRCSKNKVVPLICSWMFQRLVPMC